MTTGTESTALTAAPPPPELRSQLRAWLADTDLDRWRRHWDTVEETVAEHAPFLRLLHDAGFGRAGWPVAGGGIGGDERHRAVLYDELTAHGLPIPEQYLPLETLAPPLIHFAPELTAQYLPVLLRGEEWWGQCFSEPEAGSDLASLRTRATPTPEGYRLSGQKIWTSHGGTATRFVVLCRTGTAEERHRGLTMLLVDGDAPGMTVRPIALANGRRELAEVFFDDVPVPADRRIGEEGEGWAVAMYLLQWERSMFAWQCSVVLLARLGELRDTLASEGASDAAGRLGSVYLDLLELRARSLGTLNRLAQGRPVGPEASVDKVLLARAEHALNDAARDLRPDAFLLDPAAGRSRAEWWYSRSASILGGSAEVQRGIIADRVLGLPQEKRHG